MKNRKKCAVAVWCCAALACSGTVRAQDPIIQTKYTADPAPMVYNDTVFLYTGHDEDDAYGFKMLDWQLYTSTDMVNWTDHGPVASVGHFAWCERKECAWAAQTVERNGKFYMYCPLQGNGIGVLVADSPYGPFKDPLGKPLVWQKEHWEDIDPTVFVDDDGQAYMYWGNPNLYCVALNEDMISYSGPIVRVGQLEHYQEGPWFYKRKGKYYLAFASTCCPEGIGYAMAKYPTGPWEVKGYIMRPTERTRGNHPGIIDYKGRTYVFGQNSDLLKLETQVYYERRSVSVAEMHYNDDGTIQEVPYFKDTRLEQLESFKPYRRVEAETMAWGYGLKTAKFADGKGVYVKAIDNGDSLRLRGVDFGRRGAKRFTASVASEKGGCSIEIHLDRADGPLVGTLPVQATGGQDRYAEMACGVEGATRTHDLVFVFRGEGSDLMHWDWWRFE